MIYVVYVYSVFFFFSSRRRHTRCALVTGVQTCALPIYMASWVSMWSTNITVVSPHQFSEDESEQLALLGVRIVEDEITGLIHEDQIGRASCRERVCQYV